MRLTLGAAKPLLAGYAVNGVCADDPRVVTQINLARERLMKKPTRWRGMVQRFVFNLLDGCLTLPREIQTIEGAVICSTQYAIRNQWFEVLEGGPGRLEGNSCLSIMHDRGDNHATLVELPAARRVSVYGDLAESASARVLVQGFDTNGNRVQTFDAVTGGYADGEYIAVTPTAPPTPNVSATEFISIDGVQKPSTKGFVRLYAVTGSDEVDETTIESIATGSPGGGYTWEPIADGVLTLDQILWTGGGDLSWRMFVTIEHITVSGTLKRSIGVDLFDSTGAAYSSSGVLFLVDQDQVTINVTGQPETEGVTAVSFTIGGLTGVSVPAEGSGAAAVANFTLAREFTAEVAQTRTALSILHPDDTAPCYRRYHVGGLPKNPTCPPQMMIMAVLRYLPVYRDTDFLVIDNVGALQHMLLALRYERDGNPQKAVYHGGLAEYILKQELESYTGDAALGGASVQLGAFAPGEIENIL